MQIAKTLGGRANLDSIDRMLAQMTNAKRTPHSRIALLSAIATLALSLGWVPTMQQAAAAPSKLPASMPFTDSAFETVWRRNDLPVATHTAARSWTWGPAPLASGLEAYADAPNGSGTRLVLYFDKSRMEINNPKLAPDDKWF